MLFNSIEFAIFLPIVFLIYWFVVDKNLKLQNCFIVAVSYFFYGWWDWRFLLLIFFTTAASYASGILIEKYRTRKILISSSRNISTSKLIAAINVIINLIILCIFKYFNFFSENLAKLFEVFGYTLDWVTLDVLLPVGISFYTFQALSYTIDVYKRKLEPTRDVVSFYAFVSFFPQLVAGPIERATSLLPQFYVKRKFDYLEAVSGMRQILWGLFKKIVVADNCALIVNDIFSNYTDMRGSTLLLGGVMFAFQIYGDFSGYSDIALGTSKLFGINLMRNFNFPYFSRDIAEFWRRWHISLNTWFRDYIYIPLGGSRRGKLLSFRNTMIIFLVSGLWHGANWTFIVWGAFHAMLFLPLLILDKNRINRDTIAQNSRFPSFKEMFGVISTFFLVVVGWIIFRSDNITNAFNYLEATFNLSLFTLPEKFGIKATPFIVILLLVEYAGRRNQFALAQMPKSMMVRWLFYFFVLCLILEYGAPQGAFIYFQF